MIASTRRPAIADALLAAGIAVVFGGWAEWLLVVSAGSAAAIAAVVPIVVGHAALAWRRTRPLVAFATAVVAAAVQIFALNVPILLPSLIVFPLAVYGWCAYGGRGAPQSGFAVAAAGPIAVLAGSVFLGRPQLPGIAISSIALATLAIAILAWGLGLARRFQLATAAALADRAERAEAAKAIEAHRAVRAEQARIAREMHDVISHSVSVMVSQALGGQYAARADPAKAAEILQPVLENITATGRHALADMRAMLQVLHGSQPENDRHAQPTLDELPALLDRVRAGGLSIDFQRSGDELPLTPAAQLAVFRLVQESLTNTLKHAGVQALVTVAFRWSAAELEVVVRDTGGALTKGDGSGQGLIGMAERITAVGGKVTAGPEDGGFVVRAQVPVR
jgi:signal transduction histidine kinase